MKNRLVCLMALGVMVGSGACGYKAPSENVMVVGEDTQAQAGADESVSQAASDEEVQLDKGELQKFTDYFQEPANNYFLKIAFDCPENIDWSGLLTEEVVGHQISESSDEGKAFLKATDSSWFGPECGASCVSSEDLNEYIKEHTGLTFAECNHKPDWTYLDTYDSYYITWDVSQLGSYVSSYQCVSGTKKGNEYVLNFEDVNSSNNYVLTPTRLVLKVEDGKYHIVSNEILYKKGESSFEVILSQFGGKCNVEVFNSDDVCNVKVLYNGNYKWEFSPSAVIDGEPHYFSKITDVGAVDYNADGEEELIILGETDAGMGVYISGGEDNYLDNDAISNINAELAANNLEIADVKKFLLNGDEELKFDTYNKAYDQIARISNVLNGDDYKFDLVYVDADTVPELLVDKGNEWDLFSFKEGCVSSLGGFLYSDTNVSEYAESKNVIRYRPVDFVKGDYSKPISYAFIDKNDIRFSYTIDSDYLDYDKVSNSDMGILTPGIDYYLDKNNNFQKGVNIPYASYVYNGDSTRDEVENKIRQLENMEYEQFSGKMTYQELKNELGTESK